MHIVVNHLHFREPFDRDLFERARAAIEGPASAIDGFRRLVVVQAGEDHAILIIEGDDAAVLDRLATEVGGPWMTEHIVPLLTGPPQRSLGEVIAEIRD